MLNTKIAASQMDSLMANAETVDGLLLVTGSLKGVSADVLRGMCEEAKAKNSKAVVVAATVNDGKINFAAACGDDAVKQGAHAGKLVKAAAHIAGGNGGGKPTLAMAGAKDESRIPEALLAVKAALLEMKK